MSFNLPSHMGVLAAGSVAPPFLVVVLCILAGIGTYMMLPGHSEKPLAKIGAVIALLAGLILGAALFIQNGAVTPYFWIFSLIAIASSFRVITHPRPVYSALYFVLTVFATAGLFVLLWAEFMAVALVLIYAGAILVTYVFVIMLAAQVSQGGRTGDEGAAEYDIRAREPLVALFIGFFLMGSLLVVIFQKLETIQKARPDGSAFMLNDKDIPRNEAGEPIIEPGVQELGIYLFREHLLSLELAGLLLTIAMVGAIMISRRRVPTEEELEPLVVSSPATPVDDNPHSIPVTGTDNPRAKIYPET